MDHTPSKRVKAAAAACWWTVLIGALWVTAGYVAYLVFMYARPGWMMTLWGGGDLTWAQVQIIYLAAFGLFKVLLMGCVLTAIWLSLLARRLRRLELSGD